jgi:hypothetical protein
MKPNEKGALLHAPISKSAMPYYHCGKAGQVCFRQWQSDAVRLLGLYLGSGNPKHLVAFAVHIEGMRVRLERQCT